jgi:hypothetical protein
MTDEAPPPRRGDELASQAGLRASHGDRDRVVELLRVAAGDGRLTAEELVTLDFTEAVISQPLLLIDADVNASRLTLVTQPGVVVDTDEVAAEGSYVKVRAHRGPEVPVILRIQVSGTVSGGHITARPPRRTFRQRPRHR